MMKTLKKKLKNNKNKKIISKEYGNALRFLYKFLMFSIQDYLHVGISIHTFIYTYFFRSVGYMWMFKAKKENGNTVCYAYNL